MDNPNGALVRRLAHVIIELGALAEAQKEVLDAVKEVDGELIPGRLELLADWFDLYDGQLREEVTASPDTVQHDLRRWAKQLLKLHAALEESEKLAKLLEEANTQWEMPM